MLIMALTLNLLLSPNSKPDPWIYFSYDTQGVEQNKKSKTILMNMWFREKVLGEWELLLIPGKAMRWNMSCM